MASGYVTHSIARLGMFRLEVTYVSVTPQKKSFSLPAGSGHGLKQSRCVAREKQFEGRQWGRILLWGSRVRQRTVFVRVPAVGGFCVHLVVAVDAHVVVASSLYDGGGGDQDAVLGREKVEAQHHRPQDGICMGTGSQGE